LLDHLVLVLEFGADSIEPQAGEAARVKARLRGPEVLLRGSAVAVLEDPSATNGRGGSSR
jgi:hypothetical protein